MFKALRISFTFSVLFIFFFKSGIAQQAGKQVSIKVPTTKSKPNALLYLPKDYTYSNKTYPLICFFHGGGEAGTNLDILRKQGLPRVIDEGHPPYSVDKKSGDTTWFIVLSIQAPLTSIYHSPSPETMIAGIKTLINDYHIRVDENRIYPTGLSRGGNMSLFSMMNYPQKFPAAVIMSTGRIMEYSVVSRKDYFKKNYFWFFIGTKDNEVDPEKTYLSDHYINEFFPNHSRVTKYNGGHCCWTTYYQPTWRENGVSIYDFMLQHSLSNKTSSPEPNQPPIANAGNNQTITLPADAVTLNGTASKYPDGKIISYKWTQKSGPSKAVFENATSPETKASGLKEGTYTFTLTITDDRGATATDNITVIVRPTPNKAPVANAGNNQTITLPKNAVTIDGTASKDPDGKIASYKWTQKTGPSKAVFGNTAAAITTVSKLQEGTYVFTLTITDDRGATAANNITIVVKSAVNKPPIANAGNDQTITLPKNTVTLTAEASKDPDGKIVTYQWAQKTGPSNAKITNSMAATTKISGLTKGIYTFRLTVKDDNAAVATDEVNITVNAKPDTRAIANAGPDRTVHLPKDTLMLDGTKTTGNVISWYWSKEAGPQGGSIKQMGSKAVVSNLHPGTYSFYLTVSGTVGWPNSDRVVITVKGDGEQTVTQPKPERAIANAGPDQTITLPKDSIILDGSATTGSVISWYWSKESGPAGGSIKQMGSKAVVYNLHPGTYSFYLTVSGLVGWPSSNRVVVTVKENKSSSLQSNKTVNTANQQARAEAGRNRTVILPKDTIILDGTGSTGTITSWYWSKEKGPAGGRILRKGAKAVVSDLHPGTYDFYLTVSGPVGWPNSDRVVITVKNGNTYSRQTQADTQRNAGHNGLNTDSVFNTMDKISKLLSSAELQKVKKDSILRPSLKVYPNPVHNQLRIEFLNPFNGPVSCRIIDLNGKVLKHYFLGKQPLHFKKSFDLSDLTKGIYFIQFIKDNKISVVQKIIKL